MILNWTELPGITESLQNWYPHLALGEVALGMCEQSGLTHAWVLVLFSFLYWDKNIFKCKLVVSLESACIGHLLLFSDL